MSKPIPKSHLYVTGQNAYWDGYTFYCMDDMFSEAQLVYVHAGYADARDEGRKMLKEDKGR